MFNINNCCQFEGRIAKDIDSKTIGQGNNAFTKVLFTLAVDRALTKDQRAAKKNGDTSIVSADFIPMTASGGKADVIKNFFSKGKPIKVYCSYQAYVSKDAQGNAKYGHIFVVEELGFTISDNTNNNGGGNNGGNRNNNGNNGNGNNNGNNGNRNNNNNSSYNNNSRNNDTATFSDDDIPF